MGVRIEFVGLGLGGPQDLTLRGQRALRNSDEMYLEGYTSVAMMAAAWSDVTAVTERGEAIGFDIEGVLAAYDECISNRRGIKMQVLSRELIEGDADREGSFLARVSRALVEHSDEYVISLGVVGDVFAATTHTDLWLRLQSLPVEVKVTHNASIMTAVGISGLQLYEFGRTVSIPYFTKTWRPTSWLDKILLNAKAGLHTLVLLDIKVKEQTWDSKSGKPSPLCPQFMTVRVAISQIVEAFDVESKTASETCDLFNEHPNKWTGVALCRVGSENPDHPTKIVSGSLEELREAPLGWPIHSLVIAAPHVHAHEAEFLATIKLNSEFA